MNLRAASLARHAAALGWTGGVGLAMLVAAAVLAVSLTWPQVQRRTALEAELTALAARDARQAQARPAETPEQQLARFRASLPRQGEINGLIDTLHAVAAARGLSLRNGEYRAIAGAGGLGRLQISFKTDGGYADLRGFLREAQAAMPALVLGRCTLSRPRIADTRLESALEFQLLYAIE